jgi:hypothetical protein
MEPVCVENVLAVITWGGMGGVCDGLRWGGGAGEEFEELVGEFEEAELGLCVGEGEGN